MLHLGHDIALRIRGLSHWFGEGKTQKNVLGEIDIDIIRGQTVALVGKSGCGKSTLLDIILGILHPSRGEIILYKDPQDGIGSAVSGPSQRIGKVFQNYSLFPHMTVLQNVSAGLMFSESNIPDRLMRFIPFYRSRRGNRMSWHQLRKFQKNQAEAMLDKFGLLEARNQYPHQLSGGMKQRCAVAQALIMKPEVLLLDEPFSALDESMRDDCQKLMCMLMDENVKRIKEGKLPQCTYIIVTHQLKEAVLVADCVVGLSKNLVPGVFDNQPNLVGSATIVYDQVSPVFVGDKAEHYRQYVEQRERIEKALKGPSDPKNCDNIFFWEQVAGGYGKGVCAEDVVLESKKANGNAK